MLEIKDLKFCKYCQQTKSINDFGILISSKDGHRDICKECRCKKDRPLTYKNKLEIKNLLDQNLKKCNTCKEIKRIDLDFYWKNGSPLFQCKDCVKKISKNTKAREKTIVDDKVKCHNCRELLNIESFFIVNNKRLNVCKNCMSPNLRKKLELEQQKLKICTACNELLQFKDFPIKKNGQPASECYSCTKKRYKLYNEKNKDNLKLYSKNYRQKNKKVLREKQKINYEKNKKRYYENTREKDIKYMVERITNLRKTDINFKLKDRISTSMRTKLFSKKAGKSYKNFINYSIQELKQHLENQFNKKMNWGNYGINGWHIDHIIPQSLYNFVDNNTGEVFKDEIKKCWALKNLRPYWGSINIKKRNSIDYNLIIEKKLQFFMPNRLLLEYKPLKND